MCELFGMSSNTPSSVTFSLTGFSARGGRTGEHTDGWGAAFYEGKAWQIYTDSQACALSPIAQWLTQHPIKSYQVIAHIRKATQGIVSSENCHPFSHFHVRSMWVFALNGDLNNFRPFITGSYKPQGTTDSELAFALLMQAIESHPQQSYSDYFYLLLPLIKEISMHGSFNFLLSNGQVMYAHCSTNLHYVARQYPFSKAHLVDADMSIDLNLHNSPGDKMILIATHPLTHEESWKKIKPGEFLMFCSGELKRLEHTGIHPPTAANS
jgi:glutamine amidotransferase